MFDSRNPTLNPTGFDSELDNLLFTASLSDNLPCAIEIRKKKVGIIDKNLFIVLISAIGSSRSLLSLWGVGRVERQRNPTSSGRSPKNPKTNSQTQSLGSSRSLPYFIN